MDVNSTIEMIVKVTAIIVEIAICISGIALQDFKNNFYNKKWIALLWDFIIAIILIMCTIVLIIVTVAW